MLCISQDKVIAREKLVDISTPMATETWSPIAHSELATAIIVRAEALGLKIKDEKWGVDNGILYHRDGNKVIGKEEIAGAKLFGSITFQPGRDWPGDMGLSIAIRSANDKSMPVAIASGASCFLCENGVISGDQILKRKHTSGFDLDTLIEKAFSRIIEGQGRTLEARRRLDALPLRSDDAALIAVKAAQAGAYSSSQILPVLKEWDEPSVEAWKEYPRSAWRFYNSANVIIKEAAVSSQTRNLTILSAVMFSLVGLSMDVDKE